MRKFKAWQYEPYQPLDFAPAVFKVWLFASEKRGPDFSAGKSGCAWEIRTQADQLIESPDPVVSDSPESTQWRAYIAAATRALERMPSGSVVNICSRHPTFLQALSAVDDWKANRWRNRQGGKVQDFDIWERYLLARDGTEQHPRRLTVETREPTILLDDEILESLEAKTRAALGRAGSSE